METAGNYRLTPGIVFKRTEILNPYVLCLGKTWHYRSVTTSKAIRQMIKVTRKEIRFLVTRDECWVGRRK